MSSAVIALSCLTVVLFPTFVPIIASQVALGVVQTAFSPTVAAISLGMVGHGLLARRIERNESFNHGGNMVAAVAAVFIGWYISYEGIFYFSILQCAAIIVATLMIKEKDIDHNLARSLEVNAEPRGPSRENVKRLFADRRVLHFTVAIGLWNVANGAMLPTLGQKLGITNVAHSALYLSLCIIIAQTVMVVVAPAAAARAAHGRKKLLLIAFVLMPVRALAFAFAQNRYLLISLQVVDGIGAGIYGVVLILMMSDLSYGTGYFNLLQGTVYAAVGLGVAASSVIAGYMIDRFGYTASFLTLAAIGAFATVYCWKALPESTPERPPRSTE